MTIPLIAIFLAGIGNFAMHRWLIESGHPLVEAAIAPIHRTLGGNATYVLEFLLLLGAMLLAVQSWFIALCLYGVYTALNAATIGWLKGMGE
jgi:hypothetical protein